MSQTRSSRADGVDRREQHENNQTEIPDPALQHLASLMPIKILHHTSVQTETYVDEPQQQAAITRVAQVLFRRTQRHGLLVGESGVGKTSVLLRLGNAIAKNEFPFLKQHGIVYIDASHVGPEDSRGCIETILASLCSNYRKTVLLVDGCASLFHRIPGRTNKQLMLALLSRSDTKFVGTMCHREYIGYIGSDSHLLRSLSRIDLSEPDECGLAEIIKHAARRLAHEYDLAIPEALAHRVAALSTTFILNECQPGKSVNTLLRACDDICFARVQSLSQRSNMTEQDVVRVISDRTRIPAESISGNGRKFDYQQALNDCLFGQDAAVEQVSVEMQLIAAGLAEPDKPASVMMFAGITGVGKTELAKRIAELYSSSGHLNVYPMGNFTEAHSVSGLLGVPPGYVGHEEGGRLVSDLLADPYSVFLLDEAEKCHPNIWKPFLNLFDEGWIVDQQGRKAYAERAIFILTTNAGDKSISQMTRSGKSPDEIAQQVRKTLSRVRQERSSQPVFPPQFLSRMRRIIVFKPLSEEAMVEIAKRATERAAKRWAIKRQKQLIVSDELLDRIGCRGYALNQLVNGEEGGRIVVKLVREHIEHRILSASMGTPEAYELCSRIRVTLANTTGDEISVTVRFEP